MAEFRGMEPIFSGVLLSSPVWHEPANRTRVSNLTRCYALGIGGGRSYSDPAWAGSVRIVRGFQNHQADYLSTTNLLSRHGDNFRMADKD